jgi:Flp pilus assembly pilin Flp
MPRFTALSLGRKHSDEGASAVEYAILVAGIAAALLLVIGTLGVKTDNAFDRVDTGFASVTGGGGDTGGGDDGGGHGGGHGGH